MVDHLETEGAVYDDVGAGDVGDSAGGGNGAAVLQVIRGAAEDVSEDGGLHIVVRLAGEPADNAEL